MSLHKRFTKQIEEVNILREQFGVTSPLLTEAVEAFQALWADSRSTNDQLEAAVDAIEGQLEDVCIAHKISQEAIEQYTDPRLYCA